MYRKIFACSNRVGRLRCCRCCRWGRRRGNLNLWDRSRLLVSLRSRHERLEVRRGAVKYRNSEARDVPFISHEPPTGIVANPLTSVSEVY